MEKCLKVRDRLGGCFGSPCKTGVGGILTSHNGLNICLF